MSRDRHHGVLPTFSFAVYMFLLIHHGGSKCVRKTPRHLNKEGCVNYCPENQCPEECTDCVSGFYGSDCRRSCRGNCWNGRCALLANGRAVNCTEGCVLGWRGLTCSTRCKRPCLECDRYTGDCVGQCRDGFCGRGCLQRCPYPFSTCDNSCLRARKYSEQTLERSRISMIDITHMNNTHSYKEEHPQQSAAELTPDCGRWQISQIFHAGVAVLAAVIAVIVVSVIRLKVRQTRSQMKIDSVEKPHSCEESHRFLAVKSNIKSVIPPSHSDEGGRSGLETCTTEMAVNKLEVTQPHQWDTQQTSTLTQSKNLVESAAVEVSAKNQYDASHPPEILVALKLATECSGDTFQSGKRCHSDNDVRTYTGTSSYCNKRISQQSRVTKHGCRSKLCEDGSPVNDLLIDVHQLDIVDCYLTD